MIKECLKYNVVPSIIEDNMKMLFYILKVQNFIPKCQFDTLEIVQIVKNIFLI